MWCYATLLDTVKAQRVPEYFSTFSFVPLHVFFNLFFSVSGGCFLACEMMARKTVMWVSPQDEKGNF